MCSSDLKISRATTSVGNSVGPGTGPLAVIVAQDPMYVVFPVATRVLGELEAKQADKGGIRAAKVRVRLPTGAVYDQAGTIDYVDPTVAPTTDTVQVRAVVPNPIRRPGGPGRPPERALIDGTLVSAIFEGSQPVRALSIPRAAILADQQGSYVYVVGAESKVELRRVKLGQSTPALAIVLDGLKGGEDVILEGIQRARPGQPVAPAPVQPGPVPARSGAG